MGTLYGIEVGKSGVYKIENLINKKVYVGSSVDISNRWHYHKKALRHNYHDNSHLQNAWNKYGEKNFKFLVLEYTDNLKEDILKAEQYWIDKLQACDSDTGYNLYETAGSCLGRKLSDEVKERYRRQNPNNKPILQFDLEGNLITNWVGINEISKKLGINPSGIYSCITHGAVRVSNGFIWIYENDYKENGLDLKYYLEKEHQPIPIVQLDFNNNIIRRWKSAYEAFNEEGYTLAHLLTCCRERKPYKNSKWMFEEDYKRERDTLERGITVKKTVVVKEILQYDQKGNLIKRWDSLKEASKETMINYSHLSTVCNTGKVCKGYLWESKYKNMIKDVQLQ